MNTTSRTQAALAKALLHPASVALVGRRVEKLEAVQTEITQAGGQASIHACDIRDEAGVKAMIADVRKRYEG